MSALLSTGTAPPHKTARRCCPPPSAPQPVWQAPPLPAPLSHTPRPAGQDNMTEKNLPLWLGRWPVLGGSGQSPLHSGPVRRAPSPAGQFLALRALEIRARARG